MLFAKLGYCFERLGPYTVYLADTFIEEDMYNVRVYKIPNTLYIVTDKNKTIRYPLL